MRLTTTSKPRRRGRAAPGRGSGRTCRPGFKTNVQAGASELPGSPPSAAARGIRAHVPHGIAGAERLPECPVGGGRVRGPRRHPRRTLPRSVVDVLDGLDRAGGRRLGLELDDLTSPRHGPLDVFGDENLLQPHALGGAHLGVSRPEAHLRRADEVEQTAEERDAEARDVAERAQMNLSRADKVDPDVR